MKDFHRLTDEFTALTGLAMDPFQLSMVEKHADLLAEWNQKISLTAITSPEEVRIKHFLDSLTLASFIPAGIGSLIDIGSGGGFPGIPLKVLYPGLSLTLVDSVAKKTAFLKRVVQELGLSGVTVVTGRVEELGQSHDHREHYDIAAARGVAVLLTLAEYLLPLVKPGGLVLVQKGASARRELDEAAYAIEVLGGLAKDPVKVALPGVEEAHYVIVIEKIAPTPKNYPRRTGIPAKRPLHK